MRKIIYVWNYRNWGGAQVYFLSLANYIRREFEVAIALPEDSDPRLLNDIESRNIDTILISGQADLSPASGLLGKLNLHRKKLLSEWRLVKQLTRQKDLSQTAFHIDLGFWTSLGALVLLSRKTNVFFTIHTAIPVLNGWRGALWRAKGYILSRRRNFHFLASNNEARSSLRPYISKKKFDEVEVAYSGIDLQEIETVRRESVGRDEICSRLSFSSCDLLIVGVGQFIPRKGCWILLESLKLIKERNHKGFQFCWLGISKPDVKTKQRIEQHDLGEYFLLVASTDLGKSRNAHLDILKAADLFVLPSLQEGLPIALLEAMALGIACIATNVNAIPEAIVHRENGILVEPANVEMLADAITELMRDNDLRNQVSIRGRESILARFDVRQTASITRDVYNRFWASKS